MRASSGWRWAALAVFTARSLQALAHGFAHPHGFNEAFYSLIALQHSTWPPTIHGKPYFMTPPLAGWLIRGSFTAFGTGEAAARLPSILAWAGCVACGVAIGRKRGGHGWDTGFLVAATPFLLTWMPRAQTDPLLALAVSVLALAWVHRDQTWSRWASTGAWVFGLFAKQNMLLALPLLVAAYYGPTPATGDKTRRTRAFALGALAALAAAGSWWVLQTLGGTAAKTVLAQHFALRAQKPFPNVALIVDAAVFLGAGPLLVYHATRNVRAQWRPQWPLLLSAGGFLAFALWAAPIAHEYYALPGILLLMLLATPFARWPHWQRWAHCAFVLAASAFLLVDGGDIGPSILADAVRDAPAGTTTTSQWWPQIEWYGNGVRPIGHECPHTGPVICHYVVQGCIVQHTYANAWNRVYLLDCPTLDNGSDAAN